MIMDPNYTGFSDEFTTFPAINQTSHVLIDTSPFDLQFVDVHFDPTDLDPFNPQIDPFESSFETSPGWDQASDDRESSDPVLKYISQMLMEENMEDKPHMFYDPMALQATEQSLFDVLGHQSNPNSLNHETPDSTISPTSSSDYSPNTSTSTNTSSGDFLDPSLIVDVPELQPSFSPYGSVKIGEMAQSMFSNTDSVLLFQRGLEEASKFLPKPSNLVIDLETNEVVLEKNEVKIENTNSPNGSRGKKNHEREVSDLEQERSRKQSVVYVEEEEFLDQFDKVLLWPGLKGGECCSCSVPEVKQEGKNKPDEQFKGSNGKTRGKKQGKKKETVDLRSLLILCAQAVSGNDIRTSNELLKQIRQHSSPLGDSSQRLAHYFANGLEARLAGISTGIPTFHSYLISKKLSAAEMLKSYKTHLHASPFKKLSILYANKMILSVAEKSKTLHIIDFGVMYGFQWPILIQLLSMQPDGPPKLRITGIELPQQGFRPAEQIIETGRRLAKYCERFYVPFEYNPIVSQKWETIPIGDLNIRKDEVVAVNCICRFKNILDETAGADCPRDDILNLIRRINPAIFVHCVANGSYNAPFFVTRFREALFHFSGLFDMFDSTLPRENPERMMFEREFYGREAINVVACEGVERVERPETYKQWQSRTIRAGFKQLPLDRMVVEKCRDKMKMWYHKDFVIDEDNQWMLQGWKGRIFNASSCWVPC